MRVLLLSWEYPPVIEGGLGRHVRKLSERLAVAGTEVHVLTRGAGELPAREIRRGVHVHRVTEPPFPRDVEAFLRWVSAMNEDMVTRAAEMCARHDFDLVHSHDWLVADAAKRVADVNGLPWLVTVHATEYGRHQGYVGKHPQSYIHQAERAMARGADHLITCSEFMAGHVSQIFDLPAGRITTIPNGIDPDDLISLPKHELPALRARYAAPDQRLVLLVGRLVFEKGFHLALDALAPLAHHEPELRFVVAGTGTAEAELKAQAQSLGLGAIGSFIGWAGDDLLHSLYRVADVCIVPSIYEPFGLVALEAMASGCPCVVADTGGLREVVPDDGSVGRRFRPSDSTALRTILEQLLTDDAARRDMVAEARAHVLQFDWDEVARRTVLVYRNLTARVRAPAHSGELTQRGA